MPSVDVATRPSHVDRQSEDENDEYPIARLRAMSIEIDSGEGSTMSTKAKGISMQGGISHPNSMPAPVHRTNVAGPSHTLNEASTQSNGSSSSSAKASSLRSLLGVPPQGRASGANSLGVPPSTTSLTAPAGIGGASGARIGGTVNKDGLQTLPSEIAPKRRKVILGPGCSALDWARLKSTIPSRGFRKIKPSELKLHKSEDDAWSAFNGKVYDMTPYLRFHPGGKEELMRVAGRDGTKLFSESNSTCRESE